MSKTMRQILIILGAAVIGAGVALARHNGALPLPAWLSVDGWDEAWTNTARHLAPAMASFLVLSAYWLFAMRNEAPEKTPEAWWSRLIHQLLINASGLLIIAPIPGLRLRLYPDTQGPIIVGAVLAAAGALFAIWARRRLGRNWSAAVRIAEDHRLVRDGPYRLVRHPIYTGVLTMYLGLAIASGELHAALGLALVALAYWRKIGLEERILHDAFGEAFEDYRRHSRAVIPFLL
jgi:protein-S-isoprenylcysteine O-methyltransferase Ste14